MGIGDRRLGKYMIFSGPRERLNPLYDSIENPELMGSYLDYEIYNGQFEGKTVSFGNGGLYAADCAIMGEIYCAGGVEHMIRVGSCGSLQKNIAVGDIIIVTGAIRDEGTTPNYVPDRFPAVADVNMVNVLIKAAESLNVPYHLGLSWTTDALLRETRELIDHMSELGVKATDMISSSILTIAHLKFRQAGIILAVSDNMITGELGFLSPRFKAAEENITKIALEAVKLLP